MKRLLALFIFAVLSLQADSLSVAAAKGYKKPMMTLFKQFEAAQGIAVTPIFGNMRQVISQTQLSGKVSIVVGDRDFIERSELKVASFVPLGNGRLVLAYPKGHLLAHVDDIADAKVEKIALPDPKKAIYGKAAMQFLQHSGLAERVEKRLLVVGTVPQVSSYLIAGEIDAGFINLTDALAVRDKIGGFLEVDPKAYEPIHIVCAVVPGHENDPETQAFIAFLKTPEARVVLEDAGL